MGMLKEIARAVIHVADRIDGIFKQLEVIEERLKALEERPASITINPGPVVQPLTMPRVVIDPCIHEFPTLYYSPDGYYPCTKCGKSVFLGRTIITCCTSPLESAKTLLKQDAEKRGVTFTRKATYSYLD